MGDDRWHWKSPPDYTDLQLIKPNFPDGDIEIKISTDFFAYRLKLLLVEYHHWKIITWEFIELTLTIANASPHQQKVPALGLKLTKGGDYLLD